jgi:hypothetical protein
LNVQEEKMGKIQEQGQEQEPTLTPEQVQAGLQDLLKAVDATDLAKSFRGVAVDQGGHVDERGQTQGGYPAEGDAGGLDSMMIGKMQQSLIDAGFDAGSIAAFMRGKQGEEEEPEEEEEEGAMSGKFGKPADTGGGVGTNPRVRPGSARKSGHDDVDPLEKALDAFTQDPAIADAIDVSPFLEGLVQRTAEQIGGLAKSLSAGQARQDQVNHAMATALYGVGQLVKGQQDVISHLRQRLGVVESQPQPAQGVTQLSNARPLHKSLPGEVGQGGAAPEQLTKSEVINTLSYMNLEKGMREIGGQKTSEIIGLYEAGGSLTPQALGTVHQFLSTHPSEAQTARSYR